jgi:hypothetical protein
MQNHEYQALLIVFEDAASTYIAHIKECENCKADKYCQRGKALKESFDIRAKTIRNMIRGV